VTRCGFVREIRKKKLKGKRLQGFPLLGGGVASRGEWSFRAHRRISKHRVGQVKEAGSEGSKKTRERPSPTEKKGLAIHNRVARKRGKRGQKGTGQQPGG